MSKRPDGQPKKVAVIYHYFAHYRQPVVDELINNSKHHYEFLAGTNNFGTGIKLIEHFPDNRFRHAKCLLFGPLLFQWRAITAALGTRYDTLILLGNCRWPTTWLAAIFARIRGKQVLFWSHGWIKKESGLKGWLRNTFFKIGHGILLYGHRAKCIGIQNGFNPEKLHVIYNSLDCKLQDDTIKKLGPNDRDQTREKLFGQDAKNAILVNVTRLHHHKKIDMLINVAAMLNERSVPVNVLIVGEGPHKPELEKLAKDKNVNTVFTGALYDELEIGRMLNASDIAVMPGPVGLLAMHTLAYGVPVISNNHFDTQMPEFEAIQPDITGDFFENDNLNSLALSIQKMLKNQHQFDQRRKKTREVIERFYNPTSERILIDRAVDGHIADDRFNASLGSYKSNQS